MENIRANYCYYIPMAIVLVLMVAVCIAEKIIPFGTNSLSIVDSVHQYVPFFSELRDKLINEGSLFYSWNIAMGTNFMSLSSYYLNSPFNYLILLFSKENIVLGVNFIIILKVCLSAGTMAYYLVNKDKKQEKNIYVIGIAIAYALSNYVIGYSWNMMWMDCILMFPLLMLGFKRLMEDRDPKLYVMALFYCLYCNYYIGFMICIFLVLWFFVYSHPGIKAFFLNGIRFAISSLLAGGLSAFMLIPAYLGIMSTAAGDMKLPPWEWYGDIFDILKQQLFLTAPITNQTFDGGANLYCGMFVIFAFFLYLFRMYKNPWEKLRKIIIIVLLIMSCNNTLLNYIWHGFHDQYGIPNRFTFLYVFILLEIAYEILEDIKDTKPFQIAFAGVYSVMYVLLCKTVEKANIPTYVVISSLVFLVAYAVWCYMGTKKLKTNTFPVVFTVICCLELVINGAAGFLENGYVRLEGKFGETAQIEAAYEEIKTMAQEEDAGFYRVELMDSTVLDEVTWHNLPSVATFCSTVLGDMVTTMGRLGFYTGANEFLYLGATPFTNSIFNVKYVLYREGDYNNFDLDYVTTVDDIGIYENPYPLALGFAVDSDVLRWDRDTWRYEDAQENLAFSMTGYGSFFYTLKPDLIVSTDSGSATTEERSSKVTFTSSQSGDSSFMASFFVEEAGDYYLNCRGSGVNKIRFYLNGEELTYDRWQSQIFHLGEVQVGDYVSVEYCYNRAKAGETKTATLKASIYREDRFLEVYDVLKQNLWDVEEYEAGYLKGTINIPEGQVMFTSIPYDEGWTVKVDGEKIEYQKVCGSFIAVEMETGEHEVEMYYTPRGLKPGIIISAVCLVLFLVFSKFCSRQKVEKTTEKNSDNDIDRNVNV